MEIQSTVPLGDHKKSELASDYKLVRKTPDEDGKLTLTTSSGQTSLFKIASEECFNLARSYISFDMTIPAGGASPRFNLVNLDNIGEIERIEILNEMGTSLVDINSVPYMTKMVGALRTSVKEASTRDVPAAGATLAASKGCKSGQNMSNVTAATNYRADNKTGVKAYVEPDYILAGADNTATVYRCRIPGASFKDSLLAIDQSLYFGQKLDFRITWSGIDKIAWYAAAATAPGTTTSSITGGEITLDNLRFYMAKEMNQEIIKMLKAKFAAGSLEYLIPYTFVEKKVRTAATDQNITLNIARNRGSRLCSVQASPFASGGTLSTSYNNYNSLGATSVVDFQYVLNSTPLTDFKAAAATQEDWLLIRDYCDGSMLQDFEIYQSNWFSVVDFTKRKSHEPLRVKSGIEIPLSGHILEINHTTQNTAFDWYVITVTQRSVMPRPGGVIDLA